MMKMKVNLMELVEIVFLVAEQFVLQSVEI